MAIIAYRPSGIPWQAWVIRPATGLAPVFPAALVRPVVALPLPLADYIWSACP